jgi:hypothetical protein
MDLQLRFVAAQQAGPGTVRDDYIGRTATVLGAGTCVPAFKSDIDVQRCEIFDEASRSECHRG